MAHSTTSINGKSLLLKLSDDIINWFRDHICSKLFGSELKELKLPTLIGNIFALCYGSCKCNEISITPTEYLIRKDLRSYWEFRCDMCSAYEVIKDIYDTNSFNSRVAYGALVNLNNNFSFVCDCNNKCWCSICKLLINSDDDYIISLDGPIPVIAARIKRIENQLEVS